MAKKSMKIKQQRTPKFSTRAYTRCKICGRPHSVLKKYGICRYHISLIQNADVHRFCSVYMLW